MSEAILPCPHCPEPDVHIANPMYEPRLSYGYCDACGMRGPLCSSEHSAIAAWKALPRALRWTHEPPKVAGPYYVRQRENIDKPWSKPRIVSIKTLTIAPSEYWQFAGPIPPPID